VCWSTTGSTGRNISCDATNLYGSGDNYHPKNSHVVSRIDPQVSRGQVRGDKTVTVWGSGNPRRELLYSDDMADARVFDESAGRQVR